MTQSNFQSAPKLACTASGMAFQEWQRRPVYRVHCATFRIARELCNVALPQGMGYASAFGVEDESGLSTFRALAPYRSAAAKLLRCQVAKALIQSRARA